MKSPVDRLMAKVDKTDGCWTFMGSVGSHGYGQLYIKKPDGRQGMALVHRLSYESFVGPIPTGLQIDHLCRNRRCVRPEHLEAVTQRVNILRGTSPSAAAAVATHCLRGHEFTGVNTRMRTDGGRDCKRCEHMRASSRTYTDQQRQAARDRARAWRLNKQNGSAA